MSEPLKPGDWFVGKSQLDPYEPDEFDGTIWEVPDPLYCREGEDPEPYCVAENVPDKDTADRIVRAVNSHEELLKACEKAIQRLDLANDDPTGLTYDTYITLRNAIAKAKGQPQ